MTDTSDPGDLTGLPIPADVLDLLKQVRAYADTAIARIEAAAPSDPSTIELTPRDSWQAQHSTNVTIHPVITRGTAVALTPMVGITADQVETATVWLGLLIAAKGAGHAASATAEVIDTIEGCIAFAQRVLGVG